MRRIASLTTAAASLLLAASAFGQTHVVTPASSLPQGTPGPNGRMHTLLKIVAPANGHLYFGATATQPDELPPFPGYFFETPASIGCLYGLTSRTPGCNPNQTTEDPRGGAKAIAVVDAFDDPSAASDLATFSTQFGLPAAKLTVVYANGSAPTIDPTGGWEVEEALDTEWAHAMAPNAKVYLVEAQNDSTVNLLEAVEVASALVAKAGGGEVSMSWGGGEFAQESLFDSIFTTPGVVYLASAGDNPGVLWPSASPNVVSAGGTSISRDANTGRFLFENTWQDAGSGVSQVEPRPAYQNSVRYLVGSMRGTPDLSFDANPNTGVWVYNDNPVDGAGWYVVGGTSVSAPSLSGIINSAGSFEKTSAAENSLIYSHIFSGDFNDVVYGTCGLNIGTLAVPGYDLCTGVGSVNGLKGK